MGGGGHTGVIPVLKGGDAGGIAVRVRVLGYFSLYDTGNGGHPRGVSKEDHSEAGAESGRKDLGDTGYRGGPTGGGDKVRGQVHWLPSGDGGAVGGPIYGNYQVINLFSPW